METKIDTLIEQSRQILELLLVSIPVSKRAAVVALRAKDSNTPEEVKELRMKEMIRVHEAAGKYLDVNKKSKQRYPAVIIENGMEIVPRSVLLNRSSQSRLFAPNLENGETSNADNVVATLKDLEERHDYVTVSLADTALNDPAEGRTSRALCVFTNDQYEAVQKKAALALAEKLKAKEEAAEKAKLKAELKLKSKESEPKPAPIEPKPAQWKPEPEPKPAIWKPIVEDNLCWCGTPMEGNICPKCLKESQR